jgi:glycosyltransferase involved in cell wall biosynthesis
MTHIITFRAPSEAFRRHLETLNKGDLHFFEAGILRTVGIGRALKEILQLKGDEAVVAIDSEDSRPLAGPLSLVAAFSRFRNISILWPDGKLEPISRVKTLLLSARIAFDQIKSRFHYRKARREAETLARQEALTPLRASNAKSVLYLDANLSFGVAAGGSIGHMKGVIDALVGSGYEVDYASVRKMPTDRKGSRWLKVEPPSLFSLPAELNYYSFAPRYETQILEWARAMQYAFLYQRMSLHNFSGARLRGKLKIPLVLEYNGSEAWSAANWGAKLSFHDMAVQTELAALRNADIVVTVSKVLGEEVAAAGVPRERIVVYPNCIDPVIFDPSRFSEDDNASLRKRWNIPGDALVATFIGTFGTWHGVDFLADAIRRLVDKDRDWVERNKLHFLLVGDGLKMAEIRRALGDVKYAPFVTLTGLVPQGDAPAYLAASDIFLSPHVANTDGSAFFGSPTKLFEYMAMGRPIIASDLDQIGRVLRATYLSENEQAKLLAELFTPGDHDGFLTSLRRIVENPSDAAEMAKHARQAALDSYTWDHHVGAILDRMRQLGLR